jgi:hypothetical protein
MQKGTGSATLFLGIPVGKENRFIMYVRKWFFNLLFSFVEDNNKYFKHLKVPLKITSN